MKSKTQNPSLRFDRPSESLEASRLQSPPWVTRERRGSLDLDRDGAQHRRYHGLFEDMLN